MANNKNPKKTIVEAPVFTPLKSRISKGVPIVGIGASAGGMEALEDFFQNIPKNCGIAFVIIQHLDPNHVDFLPEILQRITEMKVMQATDQLKVQADHVYIIPPNKNMSILNGSLQLFDLVEPRKMKLPIDFFFRSLAEDQEEKSIGIILSGMGSDGSLGIKAIKEKNGIVLIQDPSTAKYSSMPQSAMNGVIADILAPANELPAKLIALLNYSPTNKKKTEVDEESKGDLGKIIILLRVHTGHDFSLYKKNTLFRRVERRMSVHQLYKITNYIHFLQENPKELDILFKELLIGVTNFFRDAAVWENLKEQLFPTLFNELPDGHTLRAWITGCSTGEEAYSLAIIFKEAYEKVKHEKNFTLQIFATDIDTDAIDRARKGLYNSNIADDISPERLCHYFTYEENGYRVNTSIREMVVFATHNVIKDPPFTKLDILSCRNLLIYMEPELQKKLMNLFHYSLNPGGIMILGSAENDNSQKMQFSIIDPKLKFYKRSLIASNTELFDFPSSFTHRMKHQTNDPKPVKITENIQTLAEQLLLQRFAPASVLLNLDGDIIYITGRTGKYLEPAAGKANMNIYAMAREGLRNELPGAIRQVIQNNESVVMHNLTIEAEGLSQVVDVTLQYIDKPEAVKGTIMVVFTEVMKLQKPTHKKQIKGIQNSTAREQELELELQRLHEELQNTREEMQTTQEELKSTNEEMQSTNEELQSTNEELTTSKEEMQSLNEELQTVNLELQSKVADYVVANNDMRNLLNSTDIATLFLDRELNIRRYTDQLTKLFKLRQTDIGRPFTDMVNDLQYPEIESHAKEVLRTLVYKETDIETNDHLWFKIRIMPYRTVDDRIDGLVITFIDITEAKKLENELNNTIAILREHNLYKS